MPNKASMPLTIITDKPYLTVPSKLFSVWIGICGDISQGVRRRILLSVPGTKMPCFKYLLIIHL